MNLPVSPRSDGVFYDVRTFAKVLLNLFSPEAENNPALLLKHLVDFLIAFHVTFNLGNPEFPTGFDVIFPMFPIITVPELTVAEHSDLFSDEDNIRFSWNSFDVLPVMEAT